MKLATVPETIGSSVENMEFTLATSVGVRFERLLAVSLRISHNTDMTIRQVRTQRSRQARRMASEHEPREEVTWRYARESACKRNRDVVVRRRRCVRSIAWGDVPEITARGAPDCVQLRELRANTRLIRLVRSHESHCDAKTALTYVTEVNHGGAGTQTYGY